MSKKTRRELARRAVKAATADTGSRTLAKRLCQDYPLEFDSIEAARSLIRHMRGQNGEAHRRKAKDKEDFIPPAKPGDRMPVNIPEGKQQVKDPAVFAEPMKWLVIGDMHIPFHDQQAFEIAVNEGIEQGCKGIYINGDAADNNAFSRWFKDPRHVSPKEDIDTTREILADLSPSFDRCVFKMGNHDEWYEKWLIDKADKLIEFPEFEFKNLLHLEENGYEVVEGTQIGMLGNLPILHGHELARGLMGPVNPARGAYLKVKDDVVVNHYHKTSSHVEKTGITGDLVVTRSIGCLCSLTPDYQAVTAWNHGFAFCDVLDEEGDYDFRNFIIGKKGKIYQS